MEITVALDVTFQRWNHGKDTHGHKIYGNSLVAARIQEVRPGHKLKSYVVLGNF